MHVVIIGAGLGGLAAAIATSLSGHDVTMLEQSATLGEVGAGIQIPPNSARLLIRWGMREKLQAHAVNPRAFVLRSYRDGRELSRQQMHGFVEERYGAPYWHIHRADFHAVMVERARELGVDIQLNSCVDGVDFAKATVRLKDGRTVRGDLIVAADGLKSRCRELFLGHPDPPRDTGDLAYRILVKVEDMQKDPVLAGLVETPMVNYWMGPDSHVVCYLLKGGGLYNIVLICPDTLPEQVSVAPAEPGEIQALFEGWDPRLQRLLGLVQETQKWRLQNSVEMDSWVHEAGRFCLLGDACHATLPYLAQGAAMAVEDGAVLGGLLKGATRKDLPALLSTYELLRKKRSTRVVQGSSDLRGIFHMHDGPEQRKRDEIMLQDQLVEGFPNRWRDPVFQKWLFGYDAFAEVKRALTEFYGRGMDSAKARL